MKFSTRKRTTQRMSLASVVGGLSTVLAVVALVVSAPLPAAASSATDWWFDTYDLAAIHQEGWTGEGVKVAVVDSHVNPDLPAFRGRNFTVDPRPLCARAASATTQDVVPSAVHGVTVAATIVGTGEGAGAMRGMAPDADVTFYSLGRDDDSGMMCEASEFGGRLDPVSLGVQRAIDDGADIITTSVSGLLDAKVLANAIAKKIVVVYAGPNDQAEANESLQNGVVVVSPVDSTGSLSVDDGKEVIAPSTVVAAPGRHIPSVGVTNVSWDESVSTNGSSFAAPLVAGMLALVKQRYPDATGNQLLQTLIRNTGVDDHELEYNQGLGFGIASPAHMLREDPLQYPDENPLIGIPDAFPDADQIQAALERGSTYPPPEYSPDDLPTEAPEAAQVTAIPILPLLTIGALTLLVIVVGGGITTLILVRSTRRSAREAQQHRP